MISSKNFRGNPSPTEAQEQLMKEGKIMESQEPEILSMTQVSLFNALVHGSVWLETIGGGMAPCFIDIVQMDNVRIYSPFLHPGYETTNNETWWDLNYYRKTWRCWTARPTDEQRKAVKWDG